MGQLITVSTTVSSKDSKTFVLDRALTGTENFTFTTIEQASQDISQAYVLAKAILQLGANSVSIYSNVVTIKAKEDFFIENDKKLTSLMEKLFLYYGEDAGCAPKTQN
ncbi:MAG: hypothetical protein KBF89_05635 [Acidimicrobiia bacterium]|nr:hypothetical protein [Acidimicrobiia bacterium]